MEQVKADDVADWKSHPVVVAIVAGASVLAFCISYVVPLYTQALRSEMASNAEIVGKARATEEKAQLLERQLKDALGRIRALEMPNLFSLGNPYPVGVGLVRVGQSVEDLSNAFPGATLEKEDQYWSLTKHHSVFENITYYFDGRSKDKKITHILFIASKTRPGEDNFLFNKFV